MWVAAGHFSGLKKRTAKFKGAEAPLNEKCTARHLEDFGAKEVLIRE